MSQLLIGLIIGLVIGWAWAHTEVASEIRRLGKFYVGDTVFECTAIKEKSE